MQTASDGLSDPRNAAARGTPRSIHSAATPRSPTATLRPIDAVASLEGPAAHLSRLPSLGRIDVAWLNSIALFERQTAFAYAAVTMKPISLAEAPGARVPL